MIITRTKATILLVQNAQTQGNGTKRHLEGAGYSVVWTGSGVSALAAAKQQTVDLILIDVALPDIEGGDLCGRFRSRDATKNVPIILLTTRGHSPTVSGVAKGGPDEYLSKPYTESELETKITAVLRSRAAAQSQPSAPPETKSAPAPTVIPVRGVEPRPDSGPVATEKQATAPRETSTPGRAPATVRDPLPQPSPAAEEKKKPAAPAFGMIGEEVVDVATGLFGRKQFEAMFSKEFKRSVRFKQQMSCMLIDLDGRKIGRSADAVTLRAIIRLVQQTIREVDTAAWWSGESLIVLLPNTMKSDAVQAAARILETVANHPFSWADSTKVTMSLGVAGLPDRKIASEQALIEAAGAACKRAQDLMLPPGK